MWYEDALGEVGKRCFWVLVIGILVPGLGWARVIYVDDAAPVGGDGRSWKTAFRFLQDGLAVAEAESEIRVAHGVYKPDRNAVNPEGTRDRRSRFELAGGITLKGGFAGSDAVDPNNWDVKRYRTILSGDLAGDDIPILDLEDLSNEPTRQENSYTVVGGKNITEQVCLIGLTFSSGYSGGVLAHPPDKYPEGLYGGGMFLYQCSIRLDSCCFKGNWANRDGGGGYAAYSDIFMKRCTFIDNRTGYHGMGGGIFAEDGFADFESCEFARNRSRGGAGICSSNNIQTFRECLFIQNDSKGASIGFGKTTFIDCVFSENTDAYNTAGGLFNSGETELINCQFLKNIGGAVNNGFYLGKLHATGCLFIGNYGGGGAFMNCGNELVVSNCTAYGNRNRKNERGFLICRDCGPLNVSQGAVLFENSIVENYDDTEITNNSMAIEIRHSCIVGGRESIQDENSWTSWGPGNFVADPCFADPGYWDTNGTPDDVNDDIFMPGDYHLKSRAGRWDPSNKEWIRDETVSICIDAGNPSSPIMSEPFPNGGIINMGAYGGTAEASKSYFDKDPCEIVIAGDVNGDCRVDFLDTALLLNHWLEGY